MTGARGGPLVLAAVLSAVPSPVLSSGPSADAEGRAVLPLTARAIPGGAPTVIEPAAALLHVAFFATWCAPCKDELPRLADFSARWSHEGYRVVVVAVPTRQTVERLERFAERHRVPGALVIDSDGAVSRALGIDAIPSHVFFDSRGVVVMRANGVGADVEEEIDRFLHLARRREGDP